MGLTTGGSKAEWKDLRERLKGTWCLTGCVVRVREPEMRTVSPTRWVPVGALGLSCFTALSHEPGTGPATLSALNKYLSDE